MKINLLFTILFSLVISNYTVKAQNPIDQITVDFNSYLNSLDNKNFENSIEFLPTELFDLITKEQMLSVLEESFNNPQIIISYETPKILSIKNPIEYQEKTYVLMEYEATLMIKFVLDIAIESKEEKEDQLNLQINNMKETFGEEFVKFDRETETFSVYEKKSAYGILYKNDPEWNFLVIDESSQLLIDKIIPAEILNSK